jgi:hypothetical protein
MKAWISSMLFEISVVDRIASGSPENGACFCARAKPSGSLKWVRHTLPLIFRRSRRHVSPHGRYSASLRRKSMPTLLAFENGIRRVWSHAEP